MFVKNSDYVDYSINRYIDSRIDIVYMDGPNSIRIVYLITFVSGFSFYPLICTRRYRCVLERKQKEKCSIYMRACFI